MEKTVLVIIDMLCDFVYQDGALYVPGAEAIVPNICKLMEQFAIVIFPCDSHTEDDPEFEVYPKHCVKGTKGASLINEIVDRNMHGFIVDKQKLSGFSSLKFSEILEIHHINTLYLTGVATEYCIKETALDEKAEDYDIFVILDAIKGLNLNPGDSDKALIEMGIEGIEFTTVKELVGKNK